jgi:hypothetical protein
VVNDEDQELLGIASVHAKALILPHVEYSRMAEMRTTKTVHKQMEWSMSFIRPDMITACGPGNRGFAFT